MVQQQELLSSSFPGTARVFEAGELVKAANTEFMGEEAWMGKRREAVTPSTDAWMLLEGYTAFQPLCLGCSNPGLEELGRKLWQVRHPSRGQEPGEGRAATGR